MARIGNVAYIAHLVSKMFQIALHNVESDVWAGMSQVRFAGNSGSAYIQTGMTGCKRFESFLLAGI